SGGAPSVWGRASGGLHALIVSSAYHWLAQHFCRNVQFLQLIFSLIAGFEKSIEYLSQFLCSTIGKHADQRCHGKCTERVYSFDICGTSSQKSLSQRCIKNNG